MLRIVEPTLQHLKIARDHGQKIVEVVSDAAGELSDGLSVTISSQFLANISLSLPPMLDATGSLIGRFGADPMP